MKNQAVEELYMAEMSRPLSLRDVKAMDNAETRDAEKQIKAQIYTANQAMRDLKASLKVAEKNLVVLRYKPDLENLQQIENDLMFGEINRKDALLIINEFKESLLDRIFERDEERREAYIEAKAAEQEQERKRIMKPKTAKHRSDYAERELQEVIIETEG